MDGPRRSGPKPADPGAGSRAWRPTWGYLVLALAIGAAGLGYGLMSSPASAPVADNPATRAALAVAPSGATADAPMQAALPVSAALPASAARGPDAATPPQVSRTRDPNGDLTPDLSDYVNNGERPTMAEVIARLHQAGVHAGVGAFSPPGTRPPLVGLAVPEDFELPDGYVRHYQATDDGQRIEPVLMFAPDRQFFDAAHQPIAIPADRVVPPELAPPGLPIRRIVIPAPIEPGSPGR
jgi:hypothetical protein